MEYETQPEDDDFIEDMREKFLMSVDVSRDNRELALEDIKFGLLGEQWDKADVEKRKRKGKPCITINKFPAHIRQVVNDARQNKPSIRVRPVDDNSDPKTAEILNGLIRNIETSSNADIAYDTAMHQSVSGGFGYIRVTVEFADDDTFDKDIRIERITNQFSVYEDPYANSADGSDWKCCWITDRISKDEFEERYPGKEVVSFDSEYNDDDSFDWANDDGIWIAEYWEREEFDKKICLLSDGDVIDEDVYDENIDCYTAMGLQKVDSRITKSHKVTQYIVSGKEVLETNPWAGRYIPIVPVYGEEIIVENKRYFKSLIRDSKDAQRLVNYWRTTTTELVALSPKTPFVGPENAFTVDTEKWASANVEDHAFIRYKGAIAPARQPFASVPAGAMQEALSADDDIKSTMGMFGASIGQQDNATSGRAIMARQRESDTGTFHFIDNESRALRQVGRIIVDLVPHVYPPGRVLRILGEDGKETENVQVAQPGQEIPPDMSNLYDLTAGKYDVVVDVGPGYTTKRQEAATQMIEFSRVNPQASSLISDLIAKNLDWPGAQEISERFKAMLPPQITGENPQIQQLQQQLQQTQQQAQQIMGQLQNEMQQLKQDKTIEVEKVKIDAYNAETNRAKVVSTAMTPEQIQVLIVQTLQQLMQTPDITPGTEQQMQQPMQQPQPQEFIQ